MSTYYAECSPSLETNEHLLLRLDTYITSRVKLFMYHYGQIAHHSIQNVEIDELTQRTRIKFWRTLEKHHIHHPRSYVKHIIYSEFHDMVRQQKVQVALVDDEECDEGETMHTPDPADIAERQEEDIAFLHELVQLVLKLPRRQQFAMICLLKDQVDDLALLTRTFQQYTVDINTIHWPGNNAGRKLLQASLYLARQTIARQLKVDTRRRKCPKAVHSL
ncbi:MAG TPA: hypothetical protein VH593_20490 [Ktedonobacteraceae bacterium]|jgi:DNA-directed RNA polymerase specialized sigma24 family protein